MNPTPEPGPLWSNPAERVLVLFKGIQKMYKDQIFEKSRQYGFTGPQLGVLIGLHHKPFATLSEISQILGLSKSTVSGIVDRLVCQGAVVREIPEDNRRIVRLSLSEEFRKNNVLAELKSKYISDALKGASQDDLEKIITGLDILHKLMKEKRGQA
ncbi:MarR family winged helix-turn-helix transcriptional regulator [Candidatus Formimonas warabiya]|uniref:MarR family transcriptional regulator n=1 Tax=Formimonas warabiya TaxID=1761012 RepID=A0A3G1KZG4_FORW1|nr:MarR family transcriptional regulator [Candidatus Formimonas warabiya]ATW27779.1 MarR family transcriptional regulator [Candidatus Formimonas warabiya]